MFTSIKNVWRITRRALNRTWFVILLIIGIWLTSGSLFAIFEGVSFFEGLWWASVTASTTGYGDYYPITTGGRLLAGGFMVGTVVLTAFFTAHVVSAVIEDKNRFTHNEQERIEAALWLIGQKLEIFSKDSTELPSLEELQQLGFTPSADDE